MTWIAGVDGCRGGWLVALAPADDWASPNLFVTPDLTSFLAAHGQPRALAIDMPIGLPDRILGDGRAPERLVRPLLGARRASLFAIPARSAVEAGGHAAACERALATSDPPRKVSIQSFGLFAKIRELDRLLRQWPALAARVHESHPELVFRMLNDERPLQHPKKLKGRPSPEGLGLRRTILADAGLSPAALTMRPPAGAGPDDLLDALACLVCAAAILRGEAQSFPAPPLHDAHGLPIAIWAPIPHNRS